jgi:hypothetical protein
MPVHIPDEPIETPFVVPRDRTAVTEEPQPEPGYDPRFPDVSWEGAGGRGGGHMPEDYAWPTNPKAHQDELMGE